MKKLFTAILMLVVLMMTGCTNTEETAVEETAIEDLVEIKAVESENYFVKGRYYMNADLQWEVITEDGNVWSYDQDIISDSPRYHTEPVYVCFNDNYTPHTIYDDIVLGLVLDRETAIYDALETALSEEFELEREGNNIRIQTIKEEE